MVSVQWCLNHLNSLTRVIFMCYFTKEAHDAKHLRSIGLVTMDTSCWVSWREGITTPNTTGFSSIPLSIGYVWSFFVTFPIHRLLSPAGSCVYWGGSCFVCSGLACEIYSGRGPSMYVFCVVSYQVMAVLCVQRVGCVFAPFILLLTTLNTWGLLASFLQTFYWYHSLLLQVLTCLCIQIILCYSYHAYTNAKID